MYMFLRRRVDDDWHANPPVDPVISGYTEEYMMRSFNWLTQYRILPKAGGLDDQEAEWVRAIETLTGMNNQVMEEYRLWKKTHGGS
jgi:hypothetical protein